MLTIYIYCLKVTNVSKLTLIYCLKVTDVSKLTLIYCLKVTNVSNRIRYLLFTHGTYSAVVEILDNISQG